MSDPEIEFVHDNESGSEHSNESDNEAEAEPVPPPKPRKVKKPVEGVKPAPVKKRAARLKHVDKPVAVKKGPGRPRLNPSNPAVPRSGISKKPNDPDNHIELVYDQPIITVVVSLILA